ncbi:MAG TPA: hypothetical protein VGE93_21220, partial [Bryobacteraceae bacterium]
MNVILSGPRRSPAKRPPGGSRPLLTPKRAKAATVPASSLLKALGVPLSLTALLLGITLAYAVIEIHARYAFSLESPLV